MKVRSSAALVAGTLLVLTTSANVAPGYEHGPLVLEDLDGAAVSLSLGPDAAGIVVHFWATWCPSCIEELAVLDRSARACPSEVRVVAVNVAESPETIRAFLANRPVALTMLRDPTGDGWRRISGRELPVNLVWTQAGQKIESGARDARAWERLLAELGCR